MHVDVGFDLFMLVALVPPHTFNKCLSSWYRVVERVALLAVAHLDHSD